jgi:hypothetical protein
VVCAACAQDESLLLCSQYASRGSSATHAPNPEDFAAFDSSPCIRYKLINRGLAESLLVVPEAHMHTLRVARSEQHGASNDDTDTRGGNLYMPYAR